MLMRIRRPYITSLFNVIREQLAEAVYSDNNTYGISFCHKRRGEVSEGI